MRLVVVVAASGADFSDSSPVFSLQSSVPSSQFPVLVPSDHPHAQSGFLTLLPFFFLFRMSRVVSFNWHWHWYWALQPLPIRRMRSAGRAASGWNLPTPVSLAIASTKHAKLRLLVSLLANWPGPPISQHLGQHFMLPTDCTSLKQS